MNEIKKEGVTICTCDAAFHGLYKNSVDTKVSLPKSDKRNASSKLEVIDTNEQKCVTSEDNSLFDKSTNMIMGIKTSIFETLDDKLIKLKDLIGETLVSFIKTTKINTGSRLDELITERQNKYDFVNMDLLFYCIVQNDFEELRERIDNLQISSEYILNIISKTDSAGGISYYITIISNYK